MAQATLAVFKKTPEFTKSDAPHLQYQLGDIVLAGPSTLFPTDPSGGSMLAFVNITDFPNAFLANVSRLAAHDYSAADENGIVTIIHKRRWYVDLTLVPYERLPSLVGGDRGTATWEEIEGVTRRRANNAFLTDAEFA